jgi:hypothetical protein
MKWRAIGDLRVQVSVCSIDKAKEDHAYEVRWRRWKGFGVL